MPRFPLPRPRRRPTGALLFGVMASLSSLAPLPSLGQPAAFPMPGDPQPPQLPGPAPQASGTAGAAASPYLWRSRPAASTLPSGAPASQAAMGGGAAAGGYRYRLGPGDRLAMSVFKVEGYAAQVEVLPDGTINLPRLGTVEVWGLTLEEARQKVTAGYDRILRRPLVTLDLLAPRPVRVTVTGEVQRPGFYTLTSQGSVASLAPSGPGAGAGSANFISAGWPTLVDAVQRAGGITPMGDLAAISLTRPSQVPGVPPREFRFDYLSVLREGGVATNPLIYDGDVITIAKASGPISTEVLLRSAASTFAPDTITVNVVGEVMVPGPKPVRANSPFSTAVMAAGGIHPLRGYKKNLQLMRLESDGRVSVSTINFQPDAPLGSAANPPLRNGDVIVVQRTPWTRGNDLLGQAVMPFGPLLNAASLFSLLGGL